MGVLQYLKLAEFNSCIIARDPLFTFAVDKRSRTIFERNVLSEKQRTFADHGLFDFSAIIRLLICIASRDIYIRRDTSQFLFQRWQPVLFPQDMRLLSVQRAN